MMKISTQNNNASKPVPKRAANRAAKPAPKRLARNLRYYLAFYAAKASLVALKIAGKQGGQLPGTVALALDPDFLGKVAQPAELHFVSGTNGKTTTNNLIIDLVRKLDSSIEVVTNAAGSNTVNGVISSFVRNCSWTGKAKSNFAVLELDELSFRTVLPHVETRSIVVTNLGRDSFSRNAYPEYNFSVMNRHIDPSTKLLLNADDLISSRLGEEVACERKFFSVGPRPEDTHKQQGLMSDLTACPKCGGELAYDYYHYCHIGKVRCLNCGFSNAPAAYYCDTVDLEAGEFSLVEASGERSSYPLKNYSLINLYNTVAAVSFCRELGYEPVAIAQAAETLKITATRYFEHRANGKRYVRILSKGENPSATSTTLGIVAREPGSKSIILNLTDMRADLDKGEIEDTSWNYQSDYEVLGDPSIKQIIVQGSTAPQLLVRLLIAGIDPNKIYMSKDSTDAGRMTDLTSDHVFMIYDMFNLHDVAKSEEVLFERMDSRDFTAPLASDANYQPMQVSLPSEDQGRGLTIEVIYPELANQNGDLGNYLYLKTCLPGANFIETKLTEKPYFADNRPDFILIGSMTEPQLKLAAQALRPYGERFADLVREGVFVLATGSGQDLLGLRLLEPEGAEIPALGLLPFESKQFTPKRFQTPVVGDFVNLELAAGELAADATELKLVGCKTQFTQLYRTDGPSAAFFSAAEARPLCTNSVGFGLNEQSQEEGFHLHNLYSCGLYGPFLVLNPQFSRYLLERMGLKSAVMPFWEQTLSAYEGRLKASQVPGASIL